MNERAALDEALAARLRRSIRDVPDFPRSGIMFRDIAPALADRELFAASTLAMAAPFAGAGVTHVAGVESRGFIVGGPVALALGAGFVPVRKAGKLPGRTVARTYALEYGSDGLEVQSDAFGPGARVLVVDDVLATGGTAEAACGLVEDAGAVVVGCAFLLALDALGGGARLARRTVHAVLHL